MTRKVKKVFVGSTYEDLKLYRARVKEAIDELGLEPNMMEDWGLTNRQPPLNFCISKVHESDIYIGIFAHRYGFIPNGQEISITEAEFREAEKLSIECLCFLVHEGYSWPQEHYETADDKKKKKLQDLKNYITDNTMRKVFTTEDHLAQLVKEALEERLKSEQDQKYQNRAELRRRNVKKFRLMAVFLTAILFFVFIMSQSYLPFSSPSQTQTAIAVAQVNIYETATAEMATSFMQQSTLDAENSTATIIAETITAQTAAAEEVQATTIAGLITQGAIDSQTSTALALTITGYLQYIETVQAAGTNGVVQQTANAPTLTPSASPTPTPSPTITLPADMVSVTVNDETVYISINVLDESVTWNEAVEGCRLLGYRLPTAEQIIESAKQGLIQSPLRPDPVEWATKPIGSTIYPYLDWETGEPDEQSLEIPEPQLLNVAYRCVLVP